MFGLNSLSDARIGFSGADAEVNVAKRAQPVMWRIWDAVVARNDPAAVAEYERVSAEEKRGIATVRAAKLALQRKLNETVTAQLRRCELRSVGRVGGPLSPHVELPAAVWIEYLFASYPDSFAAHRQYYENRIYEVWIAPLEWGDAMVRTYVHGNHDGFDDSGQAKSFGGAPSNPHWEEVFDALLAPLVRSAEFESQQHLIEMIEETFQKLGYEAPTQDGIRKRLTAKWPNLRAKALRRE